VGHPDGEKVRKSEEELGVGFLDLDFGVSVLALGCGTNFAAEGVNHVLQSVTDAEHGNAEIEDALVGMRSVVVVDGARASGENDSEGRVAANLVKGRVEGKNDREDFEFPDAARDELGVLRSEVEDDDCRVLVSLIERRLVRRRLGFHG
jgi:hypothetical protein